VLPYDRGDLVSQIHEHGEILSQEYLPEGTSLHALVDGSLAHALEKYSVN
jgi:GTPase